MKMNTTRITDGIKTAGGVRYYCFSGHEGYAWFSGIDWIQSEKQVRQMIHSRTGTMISQTGTIADLRKQVDDWVDFRPGIVAEHPGWLDNIFVCGDGTSRVAQGQAGPEVVAFDPQPKFVPSGKLADWHRIMQPFVKGQALPFFVCCLALTGPLLRLIPPGLVPPQVELVGEPKSGKSTLGTLAASIWSGTPGKTEGGGESWDMKLNAFDVHRRNHRDTFLLLDEAETSAESATHRRDVAKMIVMKAASTATKARYTDTKAAPLLRVPILSTTNTPLCDVLQGAGEDAIEAAASRVLSLYITASLPGTPIFDSIPEGFSDMGRAVGALRSAVDAAYGTVGPAFAAGLVDLLAADEAGLQRRIKGGIESASERLRRQRPDGDQRHWAMLAIVEVAGSLAQEFGALPASWGDLSGVVDYVYGRCTSQADGQTQIGLSEGRRFVEYLCRQIAAKKMLSLRMLGPMKKLDCNSQPIIVDQTDGIVYLRPDHFRSTFLNHRAFLDEMKRQGRLRLDKSEQHDRLQIHAPTALKERGFKRVYAIGLDNDAMTDVNEALSTLIAVLKEARAKRASAEKPAKAKPKGKS